MFLVGGALRDKFLGQKAIDKDWLVINCLQNFLLKYKFIKIGKAFPIFVHPITKEEYALARIEKKENYGYKGFYVNFNYFIKIEDDLYRRDLSINSFAENYFGNIVDPYNGIYDLKIRILRHVSLFFMEDPIRILRVARFVSKLYNYNFFIAYETLDLMNCIIINYEINLLSPERVWKEFVKIFEIGEIKFFFFFYINVIV